MVVDVKLNAGPGAKVIRYVSKCARRLLPLALACAAPAVSAAAALSPDAKVALRLIAQQFDNAGEPFMVIDKRKARVWVFGGNAQLLGTSPVLLGLARGDDSVPGIGERPIEAIASEERTTPAGRFVAEPGRNAAGEDIFWVDYDAAVSLHRVRATNPRERRLQRLASVSAADNRISYGCVNVPARFYDSVIKAVFSHGNGLIYVLPETRLVSSIFKQAPLQTSAR